METFSMSPRKKKYFDWCEFEPQKYIPVQMTFLAVKAATRDVNPVPAASSKTF